MFSRIHTCTKATAEIEYNIEHENDIIRDGFMAIHENKLNSTCDFRFRQYINF